MKHFITLLTTTIFLVSCSITQNYRFNIDYSGDYELTFDMTALAEFASSEGDTIEDMFEDMNLDSLEQVYQSIKGITRVEVKTETNILYVKYNFEDLDALNKSLMTAGGGEMSLGDNENKFIIEDGVFKYNIGPIAGAENDSISEMMSYVDYDITMTFAKKIKEASNGVVSENGRSVALKGNFGEVIKEEKSLDLAIIFNTFKDAKKKSK